MCPPPTNRLPKRRETTLFLTSYPGLTYLYEAYYEVWLGGQYFKRIAQMHQQYGQYETVLFNDTDLSDAEQRSYNPCHAK